VAEPTDKGELHPVLVEALRADGEALNGRFRRRQQAGARIDGTAFQEHLRTTVNNLIGGVARVRPERIRAVLDGLFDVSLDLFAASLLGPVTKHPHVQAAWREVLPQAARLLAQEPRQVAGCVSNAVDHLAAHPAARPGEWIDGMGKLAAHCESVAQWLDAGKVLGWRAGLVQYRAAALRVARALPWKLAARCFDTPDDVPEADWYERLDRMETDRWYAPFTAPAEATSRCLRLVGTTGGFRGFGGPCRRLPNVSAEGDRLLVTDGDETMQLLVDVFGTMWHRAAKPPAKSRTADGVSVDAHGKVAWDGMSQDFAELAEASSFACDGQTLAVTLPTSYHVFLVARVAP
jgi:hypothetical protein